MTKSFKITRIKGNERRLIEDLVIREAPLTLVVDNTELLTLPCCPNDLEDMVIGFLFTSGLIIGRESIKNVTIDRQSWIARITLLKPKLPADPIFKRLYAPGCGRGDLFRGLSDTANKMKISSNIKIEAKNVDKLTAEFQNRSELYLRTGGAHSAALADNGSILIFKEDMGRHNAIDKVIGCALKDKPDFTDKAMITSGRVSSEILLKISRCGIPIVISRSAPTNQAVKLAGDMEITLVGFARGNGMNIYSGEERII